MAPGASIEHNAWAVYEEVNSGATLVALFTTEPSADFFTRAVLAKEVYDTLYRGSQSFEEAVDRRASRSIRTERHVQRGRSVFSHDQLL